MKFKIYSICILLIFVNFSNLAQETQNSLKSQDKKQNLIHFGDLIDVDVLGSSEFDWRGTLNPEGFLDGIDFVEEPIYALCRSEESVAAEVAKGFSKILRDPKVTVKILDINGRATSYLYGAVKMPHRFQILREVRLNELLILSGGFDEKASGEIQILRTNTLNCDNEDAKNKNENSTSNMKVNQANLATKTININISDLLSGKTDSNPLILTGDIITVKEAEPVYIIGGIINPRKINSRNQLTLSRAISSAGGFSKNADLNNIVIYRKNKNEDLRIQVDFAKIKSGEAEDPILRKYDVIEVGLNGVEKKRFTPVVKILETETKPLELPLRVIE